MLESQPLAALIAVVTFCVLAGVWDVIRHPTDYGMPSWRQRFLRKIP